MLLLLLTERVPICATKSPMRQNSVAVNQFGFGSAIARDATSSGGAAKPELIDNCTVLSSTLFLSHARFCCTCRPVESHSGVQGNILAEPSKHVRLAPLGRNFWNFSVQNGAF